MEQLLERFIALSADGASYWPRAAAAVALLLLGSFTAWLLGRLSDAGCRRMGLDGSSGGHRLTQMASLVGVTSTPSVVLRKLIRWSVFLVAVVEAALILQLDAVASVIERLMWIVPLLAVVLIVLFAGVTIAERLARAAQAVANRDGTIPPSLAGGVVRGTVIAAALVVALEAAGIRADLPVVILGICLTGALGLVVVGLIVGARGLLENLLAARYVEENYIEGQMVNFRSEEAQIRSIRLLATVVRTSDGVDHTTPNVLFLRESI